MDRLSKIWDHKQQKFVHRHVVLFAAIGFRGVVMPLRLYLWKPKGQSGTARLKMAVVDGHLSRIGQVRRVVSKRPHETWKTTIAIVTNCLGMDARAIVAAYERRWNIEVMFKDLERSLGLSDYQMLHERAIVNHLHLICLALLMLTHHAIDGAGAKAIASNKEVRLPSVEQRIESLRKAHRDERIRKLFRKGSLHARYRKKLDIILQAA